MCYVRCEYEIKIIIRSPISLRRTRKDTLGSEKMLIQGPHMHKTIIAHMLPALAPKRPTLPIWIETNRTTEGYLLWTE